MQEWPLFKTSPTRMATIQDITNKNGHYSRRHQQEWPLFKISPTRKATIQDVTNKNGHYSRYHQQERPLFKMSPTITNLMTSHIWAVTSSNTMEITAQVTSLHIMPTYTSLHGFDLQLLLAVKCEIRMIRPTFTSSSQSICHAGPPVDHYNGVLDYNQNSKHLQTST